MCLFCVHAACESEAGKRPYAVVVLCVLGLLAHLLTQLKPGNVALAIMSVAGAVKLVDTDTMLPIAEM